MSSKEHKIAFELDAKLKSTFSSSFVAATTNLGKLEKKIKDFELAGAKESAFDANLTKTHRKVLELNRDLSQLKIKNNELAREIKNTDAPTKEQIRGFEKSCKQAHAMKEELLELRSAESQAKQSLDSQSKAVLELGRAYHKAAEEANNLQRAQELEARINTAQKSMKERQVAYALQTQKLSKVEKIAALHKKSDNLMMTAYNNKAYMDSMIGLTAKLAHPIQKALEVEAAAAQVQKNIHFESLKEYKQWQDKLFQLSQKSPVSQTELLHMAEQAGASAIAKDQISGLVQEAAKLSSVMRISGEDATKLLIDWRTGLNLTQTGANSLADALVNLGDKSANSTSWLASFVAQSGQEARMAGLAAEQTAAFGSAITGMQPEKAATGFIAITNAMTKGVKVTKSQIEVFTKLGVNVKQLQDDMQIDAVKAITKIVNLIRTKIPKAQQSAVSSALVGATGAPVMAQLINNQALIEKQLSIISNPTNYAGRVDKEASIVNSSTLAQIQLLKNNIDSLQLTLAEAFLPTVSDIIDVAKDVVTEIKPWVEQHKKLLDGAVPLAAGLAGISIAVTGMTWLFSGTFAIALKAAAAAMWVFNAAMKANPIVLVVSAIAGMSFALYEFFTQTETGKQCIDKLVDGIMWLMDRAQKHIAMRVQQIIDVWNKVKEIAGKIQDYFTGDSKTAQINVVHQQGKNDFNTNLDRLIKSQQTKGSQNITYNAPQTITVNSGDPDAIKQAAGKSSKQAQTDFNKWYDNGIRFAP